MARFRPPSAAVLAARERRAARAGAKSSLVEIQWYTKEVLGKVDLNLQERVQLATELVRSRVVYNISKPVTVGTGPRGGRVVVGRSQPGEYPRADTTLLMKSIFSDVRETSPGVFEGYVGTPLDYGLILEVHMNRSFLVRTLQEQHANITKILTATIT